MQCESYITTDGQSASLSWNKAPIWGLLPDFYYSQTVAGLLMWGALSDERTGLSFTVAAFTSPAQSFSGPTPLGLVIIFYCLTIQDFPFRRLLRLAVVRWRYSPPPPHGTI
jgi:hypothetical protein